MTYEDHPPDPVKDAADTPELRRTLERACAERGLSAAGARLIHRYSNTVYLLPAERAVARIRTGAAGRVQVAQTVTGWLVEHAGVAATAPLRDVPPVSTGSATVSFWVYYPQPETTVPLTSSHLARVVRPLHAVDDVPFPLEPWQPLVSLSAMLRDPVTSSNLATGDLDWLTDRVAEVSAQVKALDSPLGHGVIHGDAWAGNLLWHTAAGPDAVVLGDWDGVSVGPREVDLIPTWHATIRYGRSKRWSDAFASSYGYDLARWDGFPVLLAMRDLVQLSGPLRRSAEDPRFASALRQRLGGIRSGATGAVWRAF